MAIPIRCPTCRHETSIEAPKPGRFQVPCPGCGSPIPVTVPAVASPTPAREAVDAVEIDPDATVEHVPPPRPAPGPSPTAQDDETIEYRAAPPADLSPSFQPPRRMGGYRVGRLVGLTDLGAVYEGRHGWTGRAVSMAIVKPRWASEAAFVARFAREAYAAGQLRHPNLLPPRDLDIIKGFPFVAFDAPGGVPLSDPRGREGLDRSARAAAILHAARALKLAHEQGIYHRQLSPDKVQVDAAGLVRLADLGIGLTPRTPEVPAITPVPMAGPPGPTAAPAPEPPTAAFAREDIAGLGRCLHSLIGGKQGDRALPPGLASVARRMLGDGPEGRFHDLGAVVRALEAELGVGGLFTPRDEEAAELEACARAFDEPPMARLRPRLTMAFAGAIALFVFLSLMAGKPLMALGVVGFGAIASTALVVARGLSGRDPLFDRARELSAWGGTGDALTALAAGALLLAALAATGLLGTWIFLGVLAVGLAGAYHFALDRPIAQARLEPIGRASSLVRGFRRLGVDEDSVRRFACRHAGPRWEEFFEALFGYDALRDARARWGPDAGGKRRPRFAPWRDPIADAIDARIDARRRDRDLLLFQAIEERGLEARGINLLTARRKGRRIARAIVQYAHQFRRQAGQADPGLPLMDALNRVAQRPDDYLTAEGDEEDQGPPAWRDALGLVARILFGPRARFLAGGAMLAGCLLWMNQNSLISGDKIKQVVTTATTDRDRAVAGAREIHQETVEKVRGVASGETRTQDLEVGGLSPEVTRRLDGFGLGVAGLILVLSSFFQGVRLAAFAVPGALIAALGPHLIEPAARPLGPTSLMAMAIGVGLLALGVVFGRTRD